MLDPTLRLLRYWIDQELTGILICQAVAKGSDDPASSARWLTMAAMEQKMLEEICGTLGCPVQQVPSAEMHARAFRIATDFLSDGEQLGSARMAHEISSILDALQVAAKGSPDRHLPVFERLISHEEAWLHFLQLEARGDTAASLCKALKFLGKA
jgi:hypothetical protein